MKPRKDPLDYWLERMEARRPTREQRAILEADLARQILVLCGRMTGQPIPEDDGDEE